jgi:antibiotic biosynthesis monooxygenase (ABM) superfamily enzyme
MSTNPHLELSMNRIARLRILGAVMVGAYVLINGLMLLLQPFIRGLHPLASTAVLVPPMVLAMVYVVIPVAKRA